MNTRLHRIYSQIPSSMCPLDCGECCGILYPSLAEIRNIKDWCATHGKVYQDFTMTIGADCPYLTEDKRCNIYPVRPFLCRMMGVSNLSCPTGNYQRKKLFNKYDSLNLYSQVYLTGKEKPRSEKHIKLIRSLLLPYP